MKLDPNLSEPLYLQLANELISAIESGAYKKGDRLPSESEFSTRFNVSRVTVRKALKELENRNYLDRKQGKGTFVRLDKISKQFSKSTISFTELCRSQNKVPGAKVIKSVIEDATKQDREELELTESDKIFLLERIRYADGIPVSVEISRFTKDYAFLINEDLNNTNSLYEILRDKYGIIFAYSTKTLEVVFCQSVGLSTYLNLPKGHPLLLITSIVTTTTGSKAYRSFQYIAGEKFKITI
ncbi:MAG: GntR family transcriptional regulator [Sphaerochaeta sp.]|jgi:GntR family transcriptional regulator